MDDDLEPRNHWKTVLFVATLVVVSVLMVNVARGFLDDDKPTRKTVVHEIVMLKPPPPPPPEVEEEPPEPEIKEEIPPPEPTPDEPERETEAEEPEGKQLGIDAEGGAGTDGFGLVGNKGGRDLLAGGRLQFTFYGNLIQRHLRDALERKLSGNFKADVNIWLTQSGAIQRAELVGSTGSPDTDTSLKLALAQLPALGEAPPADMPQPVKVRITSHQGNS